MLRWKRYSGVSPDRRLVFILTEPDDDGAPLAAGNGGAATDEGDVADFPAALNKIINLIN